MTILLCLVFCLAVWIYISGFILVTKALECETIECIFWPFWFLFLEREKEDDDEDQNNGRIRYVNFTT